MYLGIDIGGTKTLVAVLDDRGVIIESNRFPTPKDYDQFLPDLEKGISALGHHDFTAATVGVPGPGIDRENGVLINSSNLPWQNVSLRSDVENICHCPTLMENDAKLAGLSEAMLLKEQYSRVLYVTVSTGIGFALVVDGQIDVNVGDAGGRDILFEHEGKMTPWEDFASGRAIFEKYGQKASDINDEEIWLYLSNRYTRARGHSYWWRCWHLLR
jgi:predicted NBD/HSP70 family sugar kinase